MWFNDDSGGATLMVGFDDFRGVFQLKQFYGSKKQNKHGKIFLHDILLQAEI